MSVHHKSVWQYSICKTCLFCVFCCKQKWRHVQACDRKLDVDINLGSKHVGETEPFQMKTQNLQRHVMEASTDRYHHVPDSVKYEWHYILLGVMMSSKASWLISACSGIVCIDRTQSLLTLLFVQNFRDNLQDTYTLDYILSTSHPSLP